MKTFIQIIIFSLVIIYGYTWFSNSIPQMEAKPPKETVIDPSNMTPESFAALGKKIFEGKGTCPLCHNPVGHRAPLLLEASEDGAPVAIRSSDRIKDARYSGGASNAEEYLKESLMKPSAFVVAGFGKTGSNDTVSPMPVVNSGSISLSEMEMNAVIAYLQSSAGLDITVALPTGDVEVAEEDEPEDTGPVEDIEQFVEKYECKLCHIFPGVDMGGDEPDMGPDLTKLAKYKDNVPGGVSLKEYLQEAILNPNAHITEGFEEDIMPGDFSDQLRVAELNMAIDHLIESAGQGE